VSIALHALIIFLLIAPFATQAVLQEIGGAGGPGPAGGGGGGSGGTGGPRVKVQERLDYVRIAPPPPRPTPTPQITPPTPVPPPLPVPKQAPSVVPKVDLKIELPLPSGSGTTGTGGGSGTDGSNGNGPGSGGGQGSGVGTGRGSAVGPGTGGGPGTIYPPTPTELFIPPLPVPEKVKGTQLVAVFDVDERGNVVSFEFNRTKDGGYNRKLEQVLGQIRFRPGVMGDGTPVKAKGSVTYFF
jgi:hypothetical protein